jgi:hypothetical protein
MEITQMEIVLMMAGTALVGIWLGAWTQLGNRSYLMDPKGKQEGFEPHIKRYQEFGKFLVVMATASVAFFINFLVTLPAPEIARSSYSLALERNAAVPIICLTISVSFALVYMLSQTFFYEAYCHGNPYPGLLYALQVAIGWSALLWFATAYTYLAFKMLPIIQSATSART